MEFIHQPMNQSAMNRQLKMPPNQPNFSVQKKSSSNAHLKKKTNKFMTRLRKTQLIRQLSECSSTLKLKKDICDEKHFMFYYWMTPIDTDGDLSCDSENSATEKYSSTPQNGVARKASVASKAVVCLTSKSTDLHKNDMFLSSRKRPPIVQFLKDVLNVPLMLKSVGLNRKAHENNWSSIIDYNSSDNLTMTLKNTNPSSKKKKKKRKMKDEQLSQLLNTITIDEVRQNVNTSSS
jgi:hypothetical protein